MILVYCSETGFTKHYAELLHRKTGLPLMSLSEALTQLTPGSRIAFLGWLKAGKIQGLSKVQGRFDVALVCAVGMSAHYDGAALAEKHGLKGTPCFYLRGGYAPERVTGVDRVLMGALRRMLSAKKDEAAAEMRKAMDEGADWVDEEQLAPVIRALNG